MTKNYTCFVKYFDTLNSLNSFAKFNHLFIHLMNAIMVRVLTAYEIRVNEFHSSFPPEFMHEIRSRCQSTFTVHFRLTSLNTYILCREIIPSLIPWTIFFSKLDVPLLSITMSSFLLFVPGQN